MSLTIKNRSTARRTLLLWMLFLSPLIGLVTYMVAAHHGLDVVAGWKVTAAVLAAWWMVLYVCIRLWSKRRVT